MVFITCNVLFLVLLFANICGCSKQSQKLTLKEVRDAVVFKLLHNHQLQITYQKDRSWAFYVYNDSITKGVDSCPWNLCIGSFTPNFLVYCARNLNIGTRRRDFEFQPYHLGQINSFVHLFGRYYSLCTVCQSLFWSREIQVNKKTTPALKGTHKQIIIIWFDKCNVRKMPETLGEDIRGMP